jgi:PAS domain S-box-containing protein
MKKMYIFSAMLVLLLLLAQPLRAAEPRETKRVLVLYGEEKALPAHELTDQGLRATFQSDRLFDVQLFPEYLDHSRFYSAGYGRTVAEYLRRKYADIKIDAIITVGPPAIDFLMSEGGNIFSEVPIIASQMVESTAKGLERSPLRRFATGIVTADNAAALLDIALQLRPGTKRIALVAGVTPLDFTMEQMLRNALKPNLEKLELIDLTKMPMQEILVRIGSLPPNTIVFFSSIFKDGEGRRFLPRDALSQVSRASNAPVFGLFDTFLGYGIVGGQLVSFEQLGRESATLALRILGGESPASIPFGREQAFVSVYDWRELKRWDIPESAVPPGGEIRYREPSLWRDHKDTIAGMIALMTLEAFLVIGLVVNLGMRRRAERALLESEQRVKLAVSAGGAALWSLDMDTGNLWATDKAMELFGIVPDEKLDYEKFVGHVHHEDREIVRQFVQRAVDSLQEASVEFRVPVTEGTDRWVSSRGSFQQNSAQGPNRLMGVSVDITERKQAEQEIARQRNELAHVTRVSTVSQLASSIAHELNQPLGAILRNAEAGELFLQDPSPDLDEVRAILADIRKDNQRAGAVIDGMRALMKQRQVERRRLDLDLLADKTVALVQPDAERRRVRLAREADRALTPVHGDQVQLQQVLLNLLLNAMEALDDNPSARRLVTVRTRSTGSMAEVSVSDSGCGISEDELLRVFEPFFTSKVNGLGMGLAISRSIIEAHRGRLWAENNATGGTTFAFTLPIAKGVDEK